MIDGTDKVLLDTLREVNAEQQRIITDLMVQLDQSETKVKELTDQVNILTNWENYE